MRRTVLPALSGAVVAAALLLAACAPAPPPKAVTTPTPPPSTCPSSVAAATGVQSAGGSGASTAASSGPAEDEVVLVAVDDAGRPEIVTTSADEVPAAAASLDADPDLDVLVVEADRTMSASGAAGVPIGDPHRSQQWALDALGIDEVWGVATGAQIDIAVIDTGVLGSHPDLSGKVCSGVAFLGSTGVAQVGKGATDPNGHGTHVAGTAAAIRGNGIGVAGVAPSARIIPVRVLDAQGNGSSSDVARGITWAVDHGAEVLNLSLGGGHSYAVQVAVEYAESQGVVVVAAAGNAGPTGPPNHPAALPIALAVGSHDDDGQVSWFSTRGDYVDVSAPGSGILSTARNGGWTYMSGTSMATPHVSGVVAVLLAAESGLTPAQVRARIEGSAVDAGPIDHDTGYGWGRLDAVAALAG